MASDSSARFVRLDRLGAGLARRLRSGERPALQEYDELARQTDG
jgi:hypothetical protein